LGRPWSDTADRVRSYASWFYHDDSTAEAHSRSRLRRVRFRWTRRLIWRDFRIRSKREDDLPGFIRSMSGNVTVNSSLNAVDAYRRFGFREAGDEVVDRAGVRVQPMSRDLPSRTS